MTNHKKIFNAFPLLFPFQLSIFCRDNAYILTQVADTKIEGIDNSEKVKEIRKKAIQAGLKLVDCPIRHLGTEKAQETACLTPINSGKSPPTSGLKDNFPSEKAPAPLKPVVILQLRRA